ncbi:MAG: response regulator [Candidatus Eisenbacteria bacterium]|uniref:histidine kinase n=1 Tax=Eiseniibacteriota bacterium TaxID=2212470 RepID=A0A7Y2H264_UNCEI|nr:response regulator [Candidatus Eisenbacteria bacterium]
MSKVLQRQLKRLGLSQDKLPEDPETWVKFLQSIEQYYQQNDEHRYRLERSLELSSKEMAERLEYNKEISLQLAQVGKLASLGTLASGVAHELNNPLAGVHAFAELLLMDTDFPEKYRDKIRKIIKQADRMASIIKHLRKLSRDSKDSPAYEHDLKEPLQDAIDLIYRKLEFEKIQVDTQITEKSLPVMADPVRIESIFQNLLINSMQAFVGRHRSDRRISIKVYENKGSVVVVYEDNAGGIPKPVIDKIFDPFFTTKEVGAGTGLGLAIAKQTVNEFGGDILVQSDHETQTRFVITMPKSHGDAKPVQAIAGTKANITTKTPTQHQPILIVDDEPNLTEVLDTLLQDSYAVTTCSDPLKALALLHHTTYYALITDLRMPGLSGEELMRRARKLQPNLRLGVMSGHMEEDLLDELEEFQPLLFIEKPFPKLSQLRERIMNHLGLEDKKAA